MARKKPGFVKTEYDDLTYTVNGLAMQTHDELKPGHAEKFYQRRLAQLCRESGLEVEIEKRVEVWIDDSMIGYLKLDLWVEGILVVESKAFSHRLTQDEVGQILTYLTATSSPIGMLYNFGRSRLEMKRVFPPKVVQEWQKYLYRYIHKSPGMSLPPLPAIDAAGKTTSKKTTPSIRFKTIDQKPTLVEIPSPDGAAIRLSASRQSSVDQSIPHPSSAELSLSVSRQSSVEHSAYATAGVDIQAGNQAVELMKDAVNATHGPEVLAGIGSFGGLYSAASIKEMSSPVLVASTDGVGTKVILAAESKRFHGIGQDIVNHCINDILVQGAHPLFFMDYFASSHLNPEQLAEIVRGMASACQDAGCALLGGETAEMPGVYAEGHFDVVGTIVGAVERSATLPKADIKPNDLLLGIASSGPHTNGYSLIRHIFADTPLETVYPELGIPLMDALLAPHRSYLPLFADLLAEVQSPISALIHVTGGGFIENIPRVLPDGLGARLHLNAWPIPPLFEIIQHIGNVEEAEMYHVFNMGLGMIAVVPPDKVTTVQVAIPEKTWIIGEVVNGSNVEVI